MPVKWTNRSRPPSSGVMNPKPLSSLNHFTVPVAIAQSLTCRSAGGVAPPRPTAQTYQSAGVCGEKPDLSGAQQRGSGGDLVRVARLRDPGQLQWVAVVARDHVEVEVEHRLPGRRTAGVHEVDAVGPERGQGSPGEPLGGADRRGEVLGIDIEQVLRMA